jgi:malate dehydrogenase (quinone)
LHYLQKYGKKIIRFVPLQETIGGAVMVDSPNDKVVIIGGGVTGTALAYVFSRYTNVESLALVEKYGRVATVNSDPRNNSQTLHFGDIETNYTLEHARPVQDAARLMMNYVLANPAPGLYQLTPKMVLAVGAEEVAAMRKRYEDFRLDYPDLELLEAPDLAMLEPTVMEGRNPEQPVVALLSHDGYAINYQLLSESFLRNSDRQVDTFFNTEVKAISRQQDGSFVIRTGTGELRAKAVVVCAGPYSMLFAQAMGYVPELAFLNVAGSFYFTNQRVLNGKVYTVQTPGLPFAAVHGDPDVAVVGQTRFGPTAKMILQLERHRYRTTVPYLRTLWTPVRFLATLRSLVAIARRDSVLARFIVKNIFYDWRLIGKWLYLRQMRKIVPTLRWRDVTYGKDKGGTRPQIFNTEDGTLQMGESTIIREGIIFNTTPSPGASVSLRNAEKDAQVIIDFLGDGYTFDQAAFNRDLRRTRTEVGDTA